ncbi:MAG: hypothetical protein KDA85_07155, partial [Planctomycetaceae bacterium]|nr:hypothetical protein [Planctomycetaceae bacterium]
DDLIQQLVRQRHRIEVYLQFDGFEDSGSQVLRGASLTETRLRAIERLGEAEINTILVCTVQPGVNEHELGRIVQFGMERPWITGVSFQPATYSGRCVLPEQLEQRITFPDVIQGICRQTDGLWQETDFAPLPCAHPNGHTLAYAFRSGDQLFPLARFIDLENHLDLLSGRITFNRSRAKELIQEYLSRQACGVGGCGPEDSSRSVSGPKRPGTKAFAANQTPAIDTELLNSPDVREAATAFVMRALSESLSPQDMFRITTTSFMDAYNFDIRQLMKSCVHFVLPSGHLIPFSAYNVLYRDGHVPLPPLIAGMVRSQPERQPAG